MMLFRKIRYALGILKTLVVNPKRIVDPSKTYYPECPHKSKARIVIEQLMYALRYGQAMVYGKESNEYYIYGLDVVGTDPSKYISAGYNEEVLTRVQIYSSVNYVVTLSDKCLFAVIMHDNNLPIPKTFGMVRDGKLFCKVISLMLCRWRVFFRRMVICYANPIEGMEVMAFFQYTCREEKSIVRVRL